MAELKDFKSLESSVQTALVATTRSASQLANQDLAFHRSIEPSLGTSLDRQNARLLDLAERILGAASSSDNVRRPRLSDIESVDTNWRAVVDVVDSLLERADTALDEFTGAVKRLSPGAEQAASKVKVPPRGNASMRWSQPIEKPQLLFNHVPTNAEIKPFKPLLVTKPHALTPLETDSHEYAHPYEKEIEQYEYPNSIYTHTQPIPYHPFDTTAATYVDTEEAVDAMLEELKQAKEIAVDLEHHDQRSYIGIVSLMQISTRDKDWVVDTLRPWRRKLECLNEVFADPNILKVLHGAYMDIIWLQRDLGLYLVGLFDTHYAARALSYSGGSLAFLLKKFANVDAQKQYQTADWRIRPLPQELLDYARSDTHYLLYIFDCMRNELIERSDFTLPNHEGDKIREVLQKSSEIALQRYEHPVYDMDLGQGAGGWYKMLVRSYSMLSKVQFAVFRAVHKWRDDVAREQDDSTGYIMPNHQIFTIAKSLPSNKTELTGYVQPMSQTVKLRIDELLAAIQQAKEDGQNGPEMMDVMNQVEPQVPRGQAANSFSVGPALSAIRSQGITHTPTTSLRSMLSSFWGRVFDSSSHQKRTLSTASVGVSLAVPLPPLTAEVFAENIQSPAQPSSSIPQSSAAPTPSKQSGDDDVFVLKDSKKRKRSTLADSMVGQTDEMTIDDAAAAKAERKKAKKEARRAAKRGEDQAPEENGAEEEQPFDYASAPSLLNPPAETRQERKERQKKEKNPYAKAMDAPKGLPRAQKERAGRSMTYRGN